MAKRRTKSTRSLCPRSTDHFTYEHKVGGITVYKIKKVFTGNGKKGRTYESGNRALVQDRFNRIFSIGYC